MRELRDYQREGADAVYVALKEGMVRPAIVMATGMGKTDLIATWATDAAAEGKRVLIIAHRGELLDQITERCLMHRPDIPVGRVQASKNQGRRPIVVATSQTLARASRRAKLLPPDLVIVDEAHHASSKSQMAILEWAGCYDDTPAIGVTATMSRGDKRGLGQVWEEVVFERGIEWAIVHGPRDDNPLISAPVGEGASRGWLVRPRGRVVVTSHMDLNAAKISKGDYQDGELGEMVAQDVDQIVRAWQEHASDRITVAFTPSIEAGQALAAEFRRVGVPVGEVYGSTPTDERKATYAALEAGTLRVLVSVMVTTEGWDCPPVSCVLMARPTQLPGLYTQIVGRGLRNHPGKDDCLVLDVVGTSRFQRLMTLVQLHPGAEYDTREIDLQPCTECGGYIGRDPKVVEAATALGMVACECPCGECGEAPCNCPPASLERDPDGGRRRLLGPATYEEIDLLGLNMSSLRWLTTRAGIPFSPVGERYLVLWPDSATATQGRGGTYSAGHCARRGPVDGVWIDDEAPHTLTEARALAERWAMANDPMGVREQDAPWRRARKRGSDKQIALATRLGIENAEQYTSGALSDEIDIVMASRRIDTA